jgi:hypothetical protein
MKKSLKSGLTLHRETLRSLNGEEMASAQGGGTATAGANCTVSVTPSVLQVCVSQK